MTDFAKTRSLFHIPEGVIYLDGNSLGPLPIAAKARVADMLAKEWGEHLIRGWNVAGWMHQPRRIGDRIGKLIGAPEGSVVMGDTLSIKVYQALASAIDLNPARRVVLSDSGNFPSDLYIAQGLLASLGRGLELKVVEPEAVENAIDDSVAVLMLTEVDYRTGRLHDMKALTAKAHAKGVLTVWDLAHSAGALPVDVLGADADFAVGCTYKYLEWRAWRAGLHLCRAETCRNCTACTVGLARPRGALRLRPRLPGRPRHRAHARRHAAGHRAGSARRRARRLGRRVDGGRPQCLDRACRSFHRRGRGALSGPDARHHA